MPHEQETFFRAISKILFLAQIFALLPVCNLLASNVEVIKFKWLSWHTFYSAIIAALNFLEFGTVLSYVSKVDLNFHNSGTVLLYIICLPEHVLFWRLATNWPRIMRAWYNAEQVFLRIPYRQYVEYKMKYRMYMVTAFVMSSALVEHCLLLWNSFHLSNLEREQCHINVTFMESVYKWERPHLYMVLPYRIWLMPLIEWINLTMAFPRSFTDAFIMCIGIGLAMRFHQLHMRILAVHTKPMPAIFWSEVRQHYLILKRLVRILNNEISPLIVLGMGNNMFFICFQLFNSFKNIGVDFLVVLAFWYSLIFAILRTMLLIFVAATINDFTKKIISTLRDVPSRSWSIEAQRFSEQLGHDLTALSGAGFFFLTRKLILAMGTTIITYELMISDVINQGSIRQTTHYCQAY